MPLLVEAEQRRGALVHRPQVQDLPAPVVEPVVEVEILHTSTGRSDFRIAHGSRWRRALAALAIPALLAIGLLPGWWARSSTGTGIPPSVERVGPSDRPSASDCAGVGACSGGGVNRAEETRWRDACRGSHARGLAGRGKKRNNERDSGRHGDDARHESRRGAGPQGRWRGRGTVIRAGRHGDVQSCRRGRSGLGTSGRATIATRCASPRSWTIPRTTFMCGRRPTAAGWRSIPTATACAACTSPTPTAGTSAASAVKDLPPCRAGRPTADGWRSCAPSRQPGRWNLWTLDLRLRRDAPAQPRSPAGPGGRRGSPTAAASRKHADPADRRPHSRARNGLPRRGPGRAPRSPRSSPGRPLGGVPADRGRRVAARPGDGSSRCSRIRPPRASPGRPTAAASPTTAAGCGVGRLGDGRAVTPRAHSAYHEARVGPAPATDEHSMACRSFRLG